MEDIGVVDGHHCVAAYFDGQLLLNHSPVCIFAVQSDCEGQPGGPGDNHIVFAKVGEPKKQLLVLVGLLVMTTDCRTPLTPRGSRRERYGLSLRPNCLKPLCIEVL